MSKRQGKTALGIIQHNPGNIKFVEGVNWRGETGHDLDGFLIFHNAIYGIRAMERALLVMYHEEHLTTIEELISQWAPSSENNTDSYIAAVENSMHYKNTDVLTFPDDLISLCKAITLHENGYNPYLDILYQDAFTLLLKENEAYAETNNRTNKAHTSTKKVQDQGTSKPKVRKHEEYPGDSS